MAETLKVRQALEVSGDVMEGDLESSQSLSLTVGQVNAYRSNIVADDYGVETMWGSTGGGVTAYSYGYIYSSHEVWVELRSSHASPEYALIKVPANVLTALPSEIGAQASAARLDGAALVDGTDYDAVDRIQVQRDAADGEGDATVSLYLFA
jgi:hypothetical protein